MSDFEDGGYVVVEVTIANRDGQLRAGDVVVHAVERDRVRQVLDFAASN